jgi:hypothetical protein
MDLHREQQQEVRDLVWGGEKYGDIPLFKWDRQEAKASVTE